MSMAISVWNSSITNIDYNGAVFMVGWPLLVENERVKRGLSPKDFCGGMPGLPQPSEGMASKLPHVNRGSLGASALPCLVWHQRLLCRC